jgi:hypothetical protein
VRLGFVLSSSGRFLLVLVGGVTEIKQVQSSPTTGSAVTRVKHRVNWASTVPKKVWEILGETSPDSQVLCLLTSSSVLVASEAEIEAEGG